MYKTPFILRLANQLHLIWLSERCNVIYEDIDAILKHVTPSLPFPCMSVRISANFKGKFPNYGSQLSHVGLLFIISHAFLQLKILYSVCQFHVKSNLRTQVTMCSVTDYILNASTSLTSTYTSSPIKLIPQTGHRNAAKIILYHIFMQ